MCGMRAGMRCAQLREGGTRREGRPCPRPLGEETARRGGGGGPAGAGPAEAGRGARGGAAGLRQRGPLGWDPASAAPPHPDFPFALSAATLFLLPEPPGSCLSWPSLQLRCPGAENLP